MRTRLEELQQIAVDAYGYGAKLRELELQWLPYEPERVRAWSPGMWVGADRIERRLSELTSEHLDNIDRMLRRNLDFFSSRHSALTAPEPVIRAVIRIQSKLTEIARELERRAEIARRGGRGV